jgi:glycosyltransferase involved in cell wall biosynthesis
VSVGPPLSQPLRLLFLAPFAPRLDAAHGGGRAIAELLAQLAGWHGATPAGTRPADARRHRVALLYLQGAGEPPIDAALREACDLVQGVERPAAHRLRLAADLLRGTPIWVAGWRVPAFTAALRHTVAGWRPDVVQAEYHVMGQYLTALRPSAVPRVLRQHEPGAAASDDRARTRRGIGRSTSGLDRRAWVRYEAAVMRDADAVVALTERDAAALRSLAPDTRIECIPLAAAVPARALSPVGSGAPTLLFVGNFVHPPNVDAAMRLARNIFPKVRAANPAASLCIVGPDPAGRAAALAGDGVIVTGEVPDVRPFLDRAAVVIVPLRFGGGMRVKVMEALASGKAVLASRLAIEGLAVEDGDQVVLAETDEEFAAAAGRLLADAHGRERLATAARAWAVANLGWERPLAAFETLYASLLAQDDTVIAP